MKFSLLLKKQNILLPTASGWLLFFCILFIIIYIPIVSIHSFLAVTKPVDSKVLIIEGWLPDYCFDKIITIYKEKNINKIYVTGGPLERGSFLKEFKDFATLGAATLKSLGIPDSVITEIPAPYIQKDRTYTSAFTLQNWLDKNNKSLPDANLITLGVHARRSQILFKKVLINQTTLGIISIENRDYPPEKWFTSSEGLKMVITEIISYCYTKIFFHI